MNYIMRTYSTFIKNLVAFSRLNDKGHFLYAYSLSGIIRLSIMVIPFRYLKKVLGVPKQESSLEITHQQLEVAKQVRRIVLLACDHTPWESKCLVRAILTAHLLKRKRIQSTLYLGVNKNREGSMQAHAWLRTGDRIIMGGENQSDFIEVAKFYKY